MNKDINFTLSAFVPLLRMNGEKVVSVEAVEDWYEIDGREYMKEVAEITYENGYRQYADIGCDANLTAVYDVISVIQQVKPKSEKIERIVRDVYPKPEQDRWIPVTERMPETNCRVLLSSNCGKIFLGSRQKPTLIYQIDDDGSKYWIYDAELENYDDDIEVLQKAEEQGFDVDEEGFTICVSSVNYVPEEWSDGITAWRPLPKPYQPDAHA